MMCIERFCRGAEHCMNVSCLLCARLETDNANLRSSVCARKAGALVVLRPRGKEGYSEGARLEFWP